MLNKLERAMIKTGAVIRAIPETTTSTYEAVHIDKYPNGEIFFDPKYGREMLHVTSRPSMGGKFLVAFAPNNSAHLTFNDCLSFDSIEEAAQFVIEQSEV